MAEPRNPYVKVPSESSTDTTVIIVVVAANRRRLITAGSPLLQVHAVIERKPRIESSSTY
jgi:hypothetical protein